jgi:hypothetical protein
MANHKEYYKGEGDGFPQVRATMSHVSSCMHMVRSCTKSSNYGLTNLLFGFMQIHMNKLIILSLVLVPISKL